MFAIPQESIDFILKTYASLGRLYEVSDASKKLIRDILTIISTRKGSLIYNPDEGTILYDIQFTPIDDNLLKKLEFDVTSALKRHDIISHVTAKRVSNNSVELTLDISLSENGILKLTISTDGLVYKIQDIKELFTKVIIKG